MPRIHGLGAAGTSAGALLLAVGGLAGCSSSEESSASTLQEGDCVVFITADDGQTSAETAACEDPHYGEVVLSSDAFFDGDESLPDDARMSALADTACADALLSYSGLAPVGDGIRMSYLSPTEETWAEGDRGLTCLAVTVDEETTELRETSESIAAS